MSVSTDSSPRFYSQHGEDFLLEKIFAALPKGCFVEIGCIDGKRFANTLALEQCGWQGLCVEAHADYIELLRRNRPASIVVHCAIGERDADAVTFFANARGSLSTLDAAQETRWRADYGAYFSGFEEQRVPMRTISSLLNEHGIAQVDVLSLDVEGYEVPALAGLDLTRHRPRLLLIECDGAAQEQGLDDILLPAGYHKAFRLGANIFYCLEPALVAAVLGNRYEVVLTHTQHPLDSSGDQEVTVRIDLSDAGPVPVPQDIEAALGALRRFDPAHDTYQKAFALDQAVTDLYADQPQLLATLNVDDIWSAYVRGLSLKAGGDYAAALQLFHQVANAGGEDWRPFYHLALCADATRQAAWLHCGEEVHWEILKRYPDFAPSRQVLDDNVARFAFHGDPQYQLLVDAILKHAQASDFVETGSFLGRSTAWVAQRWPQVQVHSTEINPEFFQTAQRRLSAWPNVHLQLGHSVQFITELVQPGKLGKLPVFFLDAHWEEDWPLPRELALIRAACPRAIIIIDDFRVPTQPLFSFDDYGSDKVCAFEAILPHLSRDTMSANLLPCYGREAVPSHANLVGHVALFQGCADVWQAVRGTALGQQAYFNIDIDAAFPARVESTSAYQFSNDWFAVHEPEWQSLLVSWAQQRGAINVLEVGSYEGASACWLLNHLFHDPDSHLTCIDPWLPRADKHAWDADMNAVFARFQHNIECTGKAARVVAQRGDSATILPGLPAASFDLIYIDGDHSAAAVYRDTLAAFRLLRPGGLLLWDDYFWSDGDTVKQGVDRACAELGIVPAALGGTLYFMKPATAAPAPVDTAGSNLVAPDEAVIRATAERNFPVMVSFPRTGSHWLRLVLERYFDRPLLTRSFFAHDNDDYLLLHSHDMDLNLVRDNVLYLYRDPVETVYSQLRYHGDDLDNAERLVYWADLYGQHVNKWLLSERASRHKTILCYEDLRRTPETAFAAAIRHLGGTVDETKLRACIAAVDRASVKQRTAHDTRVVNLDGDYAPARAQFAATHDAAIWSAFLQGRAALAAHFQRPPVRLPENASPARHAAQDWEYKKIIGLVPGKNEARHIEFCLRALARFCDSIVYFDDDSTDETVAIVEALAEECRVERIIRKRDDQFHETIRRAVPLQAGRELGGTHFIVIDADEAFTANLLEGNLLRQQILALQPGDALELAWIQLWRSVQNYRHDNSVWTHNYKAFAFADDRSSHYDETFIHLERVPSGLCGTRQRLAGYEYGLMHFQFVNWRNLLIKQAWYRCLERIHDAAKPAQAINALYAPSKDEQDLQLRDVPYKWFAAYPFFAADRLQQPDLWREQQVVDWFQQYGPAYFADLDIWDIDWGRGLGRDLIATPTEVVAALLAEGEQAYAAGDVAGARQCFLRVLQLAPQQVDAMNNLAVLSWQAGDITQALAEVFAALKIEPHNRALVLNATQILVASGATTDALALIKAYLGEHSDDVELASMASQLQETPVDPAQAPNEDYWISAIVSTYNSESFMRGCLEDMEAQSCADRLEIIVIDSGSEQGERAIVAEFQQRYDNIRYVRTERESLYAAWNRGVALARGRYLTNANCDDRHRADALEVMARTLDAHAEVALVYGDCLITRVANESFAHNSADRRLCWPEFSVRQALQYCSFGPQPMWRRSVHAELGGFNPDFKVAGDYEFFLRVAINYSALHIAEPLGLYYEGGGLERGDPDRARNETAQLLYQARRAVALAKVYPALTALPDDLVARAAALNDFSRSLLGELYPDAELAEQCHGAALQLCATPPTRHAVLADLPPLVAPADNRRPWPATPRLPGCSFCVIAGGQRPDKLQRLIDSIHALAIPRYEIIVAGIVNPRDDVTCLNLGEAALNGRTSVLRNAAAASSRYQHLVFCDDDIVLLPGWYHGIAQALQAADIAVGKLLNSDGTRHWDWACIDGSAGHVMRAYGTPDPDLYLTSGLLALRASVWEANPWDIQRGYRQDEDVEFSQRLLRSGYSVRCCEDSVAVHDDDQYTQLGHVVLRRSAAGLQRWRERSWARCADHELLQAAEVCMRKEEWADAADWLRFLLQVEPTHSAAQALWTDLAARFGGDQHDAGWCADGVLSTRRATAERFSDTPSRAILQAVVNQNY